jgi:hypothetical protein
MATVVIRKGKMFSVMAPNEIAEENSDCMVAVGPGQGGGLYDDLSQCGSRISMSSLTLDLRIFGVYYALIMTERLHLFA